MYMIASQNVKTSVARVSARADMGRPVRRPMWCMLQCDHCPCLLLFLFFYVVPGKEG